MSSQVLSPSQVTNVAPPSVEVHKKPASYESIAKSVSTNTDYARGYSVTRPPSHKTSNLVIAPTMESLKTPIKQLSIKKPAKYRRRSGDGEVTPRQSTGKQVGYSSKKLTKKSVAAPQQEKAAPRKRRRVAADPNAPPPRRSARIAEKTAARLNAA